MRISKKTNKDSKNINANTDVLPVVEPTIPTAVQTEEIISEPDLLAGAIDYIQCAIDELCKIADTNDRAKTAIVDLGIVLVDLSR